LNEHPGGNRIIFKHAGQDGTQAFDAIHSVDIFTEVGEGGPPCLGEVSNYIETQVFEAEEKAPLLPLDQVLNVFEFENLAGRVMEQKGWDYYSSGADDEITLRENHNVFHRIWLRPRVLIDVSVLNPMGSLLGTPCSFPMYVTATALAKLANREGEKAITRACGKEGIIYMMPTLASCSLDEMLGARQDGQVSWFQLYVNSDRDRSRRIVEKAERGGLRALAITVDAPQLGRREKDLRNKAASTASVQSGDQVKAKAGGTAAAISTFIDPSLCWEDIKWFQTITRLPIILKGIQCWEDAVMAAELGVAGIVLSNHGGRQLDFAPSGVEILPEVLAELKKAGYEGKMEVYVDGGIRRGTDIFKALALGASGVGIGRPIIYALASHGQAGVERCIQLLRDELICCMRLMGVPSLDHIRPTHVNARNLLDHFPQQAPDSLSHALYQPLRPRL
jgi:L-lactate dehydrogenase (cytochrome)